jgi:hypothetical protein
MKSKFFEVQNVTAPLWLVVGSTTGIDFLKQCTAIAFYHKSDLKNPYAWYWLELIIYDNNQPNTKSFYLPIERDTVIEMRAFTDYDLSSVVAKIAA